MVNPVSPRTKCSTEIDKAQLHVQLYEGPSKDKMYLSKLLKTEINIYLFYIDLCFQEFRRYKF